MKRGLGIKETGVQVNPGWTMQLSQGGWPCPQVGQHAWPPLPVQEPDPHGPPMPAAIFASCPPDIRLCTRWSVSPTSASHSMLAVSCPK